MWGGMGDNELFLRLTVGNFGVCACSFSWLKVSEFHSQPNEKMFNQAP